MIDALNQKRERLVDAELAGSAAHGPDADRGVIGFQRVEHRRIDGRVAAAQLAEDRDGGRWARRPGAPARSGE